MGLDRGSADLGPNDDAFCAKVVRVKGPEGMTVEEGSRTAIFLTVEGSDGGKTRKTPLNAGENDMEPVVGIEPTTYGLRNRCSATELHRPWSGNVAPRVGLPCGDFPGSGARLRRRRNEGGR